MKAGAGDAFADVMRLNQDVMDLQRVAYLIRKEVGPVDAAGTLRDLEALIDEKIRQIKIRRNDWAELSGEKV